MQPDAPKEWLSQPCWPLGRAPSALEDACELGADNNCRQTDCKASLSYRVVQMRLRSGAKHLNFNFIHHISQSLSYTNISLFESFGQK